MWVIWDSGRDLPIGFVHQIKTPLQGDKDFSAKISDVEICSDLTSLVAYHNNVIIKPDSILSIKTIKNMPFDLLGLVRFEDTSGRSYQGKIVWTGKVNGVKVGLIALVIGDWTVRHH